MMQSSMSEVLIAPLPLHSEGTTVRYSRDQQLEEGAHGVENVHIIVSHGFSDGDLGFTRRRLVDCCFSEGNSKSVETSGNMQRVAVPILLANEEGQTD
jgi:hypothetical protein